MTRTCVEAMAATQGHTQSMHTNSLDATLGLPTELTESIARNTQIFLQDETDTDEGIDPWGGSYYVEALTVELAGRAWAQIVECEAQGGMTKAIEAWLPKIRIAEAAARTQALIDSGRQTVVGLNKYQPATDEPVNVLKIDNTAVRLSHIKRLKELRAQRDQHEVDAALAALTECARTSRGNLLDLSIRRPTPRPLSARSARRSRRCMAASSPPRTSPAASTPRTWARPRTPSSGCVPRWPRS